VNLGPKVNSTAHDVQPRISPDGHTLYFYTENNGTYNNWFAPILPIVDFNGDGKVDGKDVLIMAEHWSQAVSLCDIGPYAWGDGVVDAQDLLVLAQYMVDHISDVNDTD
jgi:hypothetical protein